MLLGRDQDAAVRAVLWAMRDARTGRRLLEHMAAWARVLYEVSSRPDGQAAGFQLVGYMTELAEGVTFEEIRSKIIETVGSQVEGTMATIAEQLRKEGEARGEARGRQEGQRALLARLLRARFGEVPERPLERVNAATDEQLERWAERVLTAGSLEEVLDS